MRLRVLRLSAATVLTVGAVLAVAAGAAEVLSQAESDSLQEKLTRIGMNGAATPPAALAITVSETELNSYLKFGLVDTLPPSVSDPTVALGGEGRVTLRATVDLDQVAAERSSGGGLDPLALVGGAVPVTVVGVVVARGGVARVTLESTTIAGWSVPSLVLQQLVTYYSRSPEYPDGVALDDPFPLPAGIRAITFGEGLAVIVQ